MSQSIKEYYSKTKLDKRLVDKKLELLEKHKDIMLEFEYWLETRQYKPNGVLVEGYSAKDLSQISIFLDGEAAFVFLIELRENPERALNQIAKGFKMK